MTRATNNNDRNAYRQLAKLPRTHAQVNNTHGGKKRTHHTLTHTQKHTVCVPFS